MSSLYNLLAEIGSILKDIFQLSIFIKQKMHSLANEKMIYNIKKCVVFGLIVVFKGDCPHLKIRDQSMIVLAIAIAEYGINGTK